MKSLRRRIAGGKRRRMRKIGGNAPSTTKLEDDSPRTLATSGRNKGFARKESTKAGCRRTASPPATDAVLTFTKIAQDGLKRDTATRESQGTNGCRRTA